MKITPKLQQGGAAPPFVSWSPVPSTPVAPSTEETKKSTESAGGDEILSKEMVKLLMEHGLPSDVNAFVGALQELYNDPMYKATGKMNTSSLSNKYLSLIGRINNIKFGKEAYDKNITRLTENGGLGDIAISSTGRMVVQNLENGQLEQLSPTEFKEHYGEYKAMTNGDLAHLRAVNPNMAFDNNIFSVLSNGIGSTDIQKYLNQAISNLGSSSIKTEGYISNKGTQILNGLGQIENNPEVQKSLLSDGVYKVSSDNKSNYEQGKQALNYIMNTLPENAKSYLRAKAAVSGLDPDTGAQTILTQYISSKFNTEVSNTADFDSAATKAAGGSSDSKATAPVTQIDTMLEEIATSNNTYTFNPGTTIQFSTQAIRNPIMLTLDGKKPVESSRLDTVLNNSTLSMGDRNSMYFGDKKINPEDTENIMYMDTSGLSMAYMPITTGDDGSIKPDLGAMENIDIAEKKIKEEGNIDEIRKKQIYADNNVAAWYNLKKDPKALANKGLVAKFMLTDAIAADRKGGDFENDYVEKFTSSDYDKYLDFMNRRLNEQLDKKDKEDVNDGWLLSWGRTNAYKGTLFVLVPEDTITPRILAGSANRSKSDTDMDEILKQNAQNVQLKQSGM